MTKMKTTEELTKAGKPKKQAVAIALKTARNPHLGNKGDEFKKHASLRILQEAIEKETGRADDRPMVASVFVNRLRIGMPLQTDPTVIYGLGEAFDGNLRKRDLQSDTPFNTYLRGGLPPTPIATPTCALTSAAAGALARAGAALDLAEAESDAEPEDQTEEGEEGGDQSGQQDDALALLSQGAKQSSATPQLHGYYAGQLLRLKRHADSAVEFRAALRSDPVQTDWLIGLGLALQGAGQNKEAIEALRRPYETGKLSPERKDLVEQMIAGLKTKT